MANLFRSSGPHIESPETIETNMWSVVIALIPALIAGTYFFGLYALYLVLASALSAVLFEKPFVKSKATLGDGSAFLAGILLGLTLPPTVPWWMPILGGFLTVVIGKHLFGGLGSNIFNPALVARAILLLSYPALMIEWVSPVDGVSAATALQLGSDSFSYTELIIGNIPGSIGETSVIALLIGGVYLYLRDYIDLRIPLSFVAGAAGAAMIFGQDPFFAVFSGGLIFAAIYMATDMVTSPVAKWAKIVYGLAGGFLTIFIRRYTPYPEGITFAILIINGASYFLDNAFEEPHFGEVEYVKKRVAHFSAIIMAAVLILLVGMTLIDDDDPYPGSLTYNHLKEAVPAAESFEIIERDDNDILFAARAEEEIIKDLVYISRNGFEAPIEVLLTLEPEGSIDNITIINESESPTLGARIKDQDFLAQFREFSTDDADQVMAETDMISGATFSSQTVSRAVQAGLRLLIEDQEAGLQDGVYQGQAEGAQGDIVLEITVENGDIVDVEILEEEETEHLADPAYEELEAQLLREQTADLDIISGATYTSEAYMEAVQQAIDQASPETSSDGDFEDGTYQGSAQGHSGQIELEVVVEAGEITEIKVLSQEETEGLGDDAIEEIAAQIIEEQSLEVDSISGATNSSEGTINAVRNALDSDSESAEGEEEAEAEEESESDLISLSDLDLEDGEYRGSAEGHRAPIEVSVLVEDNEINEIRIVSQEESPGVGDEAMAELSESLLADQSLEVDLVSGATNSSEAFLKAINNALTGERYGSLEEAEDLQTAQEILEAEEESDDESEEDSDTDSSATWEEEDSDLDLEDGEYRGSAEGYKSEIELNVIVEEGEITEIEVISQGETEDLGDDAIEEIKAAIIEEQSLDVDAVSGATNSSEATIKAVENALAEEDSEDEVSGEEDSEEESESDLISLSDLDLEDGEYRGSAEGHRAPIEVSVLVEDNEINELRIVSQEESPGVGDEAMAELTESLLADQSLEVDLVSGATNSSEAFLKAINNALTGERYGSLEEAEDLQTAQEILEAEEESAEESEEDSDTDSSATWDEEESDSEENAEETDEEAAEGGSNG